MTRSNPVSWLAHHARRGVTDLPGNIVWAADTVLEKPAKSAGRTLQSVGHQAASAVAEVNPFADGADGRVDAALERAQELSKLLFLTGDEWHVIQYDRARLVAGM